MVAKKYGKLCDKLDILVGKPISRERLTPDPEWHEAAAGPEFETFGSLSNLHIPLLWQSVSWTVRRTERSHFC